MARVDIRNLGMLRPGQGTEKVWVLKGVSLTVGEGEYLALVGPSGAGKTTLLRLIAGLEACTEGSIVIDGRDMSGVEPRDRDVAMVFQSHALYPHLTVRENLALGLVLRKHPRAEIERRVREAAALLSLEACLDRQPGGLSGGERQRVALGRALVRKPRLFLLDEPLSDLDRPRRTALQEGILRLHDRLGATLIHVTHDQMEAMSMGDRVAVLHQGVIQQVAEPAFLYHHPANRFVAGFIGSPPMNLFEGRLIAEADAIFFQAGREPDGQGAAIRFRLSGPQAQVLGALAGGRLVCGVRPEDVECTPGSLLLPDAGVGLVMRREILGAEVLLRIAIGDQSLAARCPGRLATQPGQRVALRIVAEALRFFDPQTGESVPPRPG